MMFTTPSCASRTACWRIPATRSCSAAWRIAPTSSTATPRWHRPMTRPAPPSTPRPSSRAAISPPPASRMGLYEKAALPLALEAVGKLDISDRRDAHKPPDRHDLHGLLRAGARHADCGGPRPALLGRAQHGRLHGLLRGLQRAQARPPHRAVGARGAGARGEPRTLHAASAGDAGSGEGAVVPRLCRWTARLPW